MNRLAPVRLRRTLGAATRVREPARFLAAELRGGQTVGEYTLRESGLRVVVRHPLLDMWVLEEIFRFKTYEFPDPVASVLSTAAVPLRVLDLGAHIGCFGLFIFSRFPESELVSFEPDPRNVQSLRRCIDANRLGSRWSVVEACAAVSDGNAQLISDFHLSRVAPDPAPAGVGARPREDLLSPIHRHVASAFPFMSQTPLMVDTEHRSVAARDVFPYLEAADLVKIDIEGGEWELLRDPRFAELGALALVIEYHSFYAEEDDPRALLEQHLTNAGYEVGFHTGGGHAGVVWAWKNADRGP